MLRVQVITGKNLNCTPLRKIPSPKSHEVSLTGEWKKLHKEELVTYSTPLTSSQNLNTGGHDGLEQQLRWKLQERLKAKLSLRLTKHHAMKTY
jgi:hypothetical protein